MLILFSLLRFEFLTIVTAAVTIVITAFTVILIDTMASVSVVIIIFLLPHRFLSLPRATLDYNTRHILSWHVRTAERCEVKYFDRMAAALSMSI